MVNTRRSEQYALFTLLKTNRAYCSERRVFTTGSPQNYTLLSSFVHGVTANLTQFSTVISQPMWYYLLRGVRLTYAVYPVWTQGVTSRAGTNIATFCVGTDPLAEGVTLLTAHAAFVNVCGNNHNLLLLMN